MESLIPAQGQDPKLNAYLSNFIENLMSITTTRIYI
jgi:hypothetical protein